MKNSEANALVRAAFEQGYARALSDARAAIRDTATHSPLGSAYGTLDWRRMALAALEALVGEEQP